MTNSGDTCLCTQAAQSPVDRAAFVIPESRGGAPVDFPLSERIEAEVRRLIAKKAAIEPRGFDSARLRAEVQAEIDARLDEWNEVTLLDSYEPEMAP